MISVLVPFVAGFMLSSPPEISATGVATARSEPSHVHLIYEFTGTGPTGEEARTAAEKLISSFTEAVRARSASLVVASSPMRGFGGESTTSPGDSRWRTARKVGPIPINEARDFIEYVSRALPALDRPELYESYHQDSPRLEAEAIRMASRNARDRAEASAEALGFRLGDVVLIEIREVSMPWQVPTPTYSIATLLTENARTVSCTATVVVRYALRDK
jgi:hypothetical protein